MAARIEVYGRRVTITNALRFESEDEHMLSFVDLAERLIDGRGSIPSVMPLRSRFLGEILVNHFLSRGVPARLIDWDEEKRVPCIVDDYSDLEPR